MRFGEAGQALYDAVTAQFELDPDDYAVLGEAARTLDELDELHAAIGRDGITVEGSTGQTRVHPAYDAILRARQLFAKLMLQLDLPDGDEDCQQPESWTSERARNAARTRWNMPKGWRGAS